MIEYIIGNIFDAPCEAIVNTVNTVGIMGKGLAYQFQKAFPQNLQTYINACKKETLQIGTLLVVKDHNAFLGEKLIINFPTKIHWRNPSKYEYIEAGLNSLPTIIHNYNINSIAIPQLGCGNGGLDWNIVKPMIENKLKDLPIKILIYTHTP